MTTIQTRRLMICVVAALLLTSQVASAVDTVIRRSTKKYPRGEITTVSQTEIVVTPQVGEPTSVPANDVEDVDYQAAPPDLRRARAQERSGQFAEALATYAEVAENVPPGNPHLRAEIEFLQARTRGKSALGDPTQFSDAAAALEQFIQQHADHYRYYAAQQFLGELRLAADDLAGAEQAFAIVAAAPWADTQMAGKLGSAQIQVRQGDAAAAQAIFDEIVASARANDPATAARRLQAMLGQAQCLQALGRHEDAVPVYETVAREADRDSSRLQAQAYIGQGESYLAAGDRTKEAIMKFLIVDVVPSLSQHSDLHAQALYELAQLWPTVGQPVRGAEASAKLQQDYPHSEWTKKLSGAE